MYVSKKNTDHVNTTKDRKIALPFTKDATGEEEDAEEEEEENTEAKFPRDDFTEAVIPEREVMEEDGWKYSPSWIRGRRNAPTLLLIVAWWETEGLGMRRRETIRVTPYCIR